MGEGKDREIMAGHAKLAQSRGSAPTGKHLWIFLQKPCEVLMAPCGFLASQLG